MLGFSFSLVDVSGGAERDEASIFVDGRWVWTGLYGGVEGRWMLSRTKHGLMLLHASLKNVIARVELSGAGYMMVLGVQNPECAQCMPKTAQVIDRRNGRKVACQNRNALNFMVGTKHGGS